METLVFTVYNTTNELLVSFNQEQIKLGLKYDPSGKHLKAIHKGRVSPRANTGLVPSQEDSYDLKSKVLGKGGDNLYLALLRINS